MAIDGRQFYDEPGRPVFEPARRSSRQADESAEHSATTEIEAKPNGPGEEAEVISAEVGDEALDGVETASAEGQPTERAMDEDEPPNHVDGASPPLIELIPLRLPGSREERSESGGPISLERDSDADEPAQDRANDWSQQQPEPATTPAERYWQ